MAKHTYPAYHKALLEQSLYPAAPRKIKCEETPRSYLYRTGAHVYKIRKDSHLYASPAIKERYAQQALLLGQRWAPKVVEAVVPIMRTAEGYALGGPGEAEDYALRMVQLPDGSWLQRLLAAGKVTPTHIGRLARFLAERHGEAEQAERAADGVRPANVPDLLEELSYQSRKYVEQTVSQPLLDMIVRPLERYLEESRKLLGRRQKRGQTVDGHGAFVPAHIHLRGTELCVISPLEAQPKFRVLDAANDIALLVNALHLDGHTELADLFVKRYLGAAKDRDLPRVLPIYRILQALRHGLLCSERRSEQPPDSPERAALTEQSRAWYNLGLAVARDLGRIGATAEQQGD